ncbi:hypothetical protein GCM10009776_26050 [Microbacterium deminutum]|uniref:Uncharacterized protein n=1 Tax=Microbacterium deminutum TaxID=344164 RepID=A0ABN2R229_9MICO
MSLRSLASFFAVSSEPPWSVVVVSLGIAAPYPSDMLAPLSITGIIAGLTSFLRPHVTRQLGLA